MIYLKSHEIYKIPFGRRATIFPGTIDFIAIFLDKVSRKHIKKTKVEIDRKLVIVEGSSFNVDSLKSGKLIRNRKGKILVISKLT